MEAFSYLLFGTSNRVWIVGLGMGGVSKQYSQGLAADLNNDDEST